MRLDLSDKNFQRVESMKVLIFKRESKSLIFSKRVRMYYGDDKSETGQLGQIGHSWAVLKEKNPFYTFISFKITSSIFIKKSLYKSLL